MTPFRYDTLGFFCKLIGISSRVVPIENVKTGAPASKQVNAVTEAGAAHKVQWCDTLANVFYIQVWLITIGGLMIRLRGIVVYSPSLPHGILAHSP